MCIIISKLQRGRAVQINKFVACLTFVKPARLKTELHFARAARALTGRYMCEAFCPNIQPRARSYIGLAILPGVAWPAARSAALWAFCRRQNAPKNIFGLNMR